MAGWPTVPSWTPGEVVTSTDLNLLRDALNAIGNAWSTYTPTWTAATTDPTPGASVVSGSYRNLGHTADVHIVIQVGSGFAAGTGAYRFGLPSGVTPLRANPVEAMGFATVLDLSSSTSYKAATYLFSSTAVSLLGDSGVWGAAAPVTWATGDRISIHIPALEIA